MQHTEPLRIAIIGLGNCASSLLQGLSFYRDAQPGAEPPGLMHAAIGGYRVGHIELVAAFDVNAEKVGADAAHAIFAKPNNTVRFADVPLSGVKVMRGPLLDGIGHYLDAEIPISQAREVDVAAVLKDARAQVVINYLPVGSELATRAYAEAALRAGCAFVNCIPVFLASDAAWAAKFSAAGLPILGDDIKSQLGATILHRQLTRLFAARGVKLERTYQLNFGGNSDFLNMLERSRLESKKLSKTRAVTSAQDAPIETGNVHVGPSDFVPWLSDRKWAYIRMEGTGFGGQPIHVETKLEVWDSPNSAGVVIDAVRCAGLALQRGLGGAIAAPSAAFMKSPPEQMPDEVAWAALEAFTCGA